MKFLLKTALAVVIVMLLSAIFFGCAQNTETKQPVQQSQPTKQEQGALGSQSEVNIWITNDARKPGQLDEEFPTSMPSVDFEGGGSDGAGNKVATARTGRGHMQSAFTLNVQTGGSATGPQSAGMSGQMTGSPNATVTPTFSPRADLNTPIAIGLPGSAPNASGNMGSGTQNFTATTDLQTLLMRMAASNDPAERQSLLNSVFAFFGKTAPQVTSP